ncbi:phospholipid scramblase-related protein [Parafrankia elaeagni]|uniref:phospholipid scramblase-related protein n=1 Tax=Parafrankia elaeagni TaxID=222534 RepID=UPI00036F1722|nr:phospholipid scramblase-related protein [Parafrankia elaeagni]
MSTPPGWYDDPSGAPGSRWWDGNQWTDHTQPGSPPPPPQHGQPPGGWGGPQGYQPPPIQTSHTPDRIQRQVQERAGVHVPAQGGGSLFSEPVLVVNQKTKLIELTNEYAVFNQQGTQIGSVVQVGQSALKKVARFLWSLDQFFTHRLEVRDAAGVPQLLLTRPRKFLKSKVIVALPDGREVGRIVQQNVFGKISFSIEADGNRLGMLKAENWRAWNFSIVDHTDAEIARVTKTWEGLARTLFTTADNYVVQLHRPLPQPMLSLVVASALTIDTALKQDSRGFG